MTINDLQGALIREIEKITMDCWMRMHPRMKQNFSLTS